MTCNIPRLVIAGLSGDAGKTIVSLALLADFRRKGLAVSAFKKGPDYIDAAWLKMAAASTCRNLDTFLVDPRQVRDIFIRHSRQAEIALVEGNRGLFDGRDVSGTHSTAALAELLETPVILVADCTKTTRTMAALVQGCLSFMPQLNIAGIILNRVAGPRHERIVRQSIEQYCSRPVWGAFPKLPADETLIPGRHLGLIPPAEFETTGLVDRLADLADRYLDTDAIMAAARTAAPLTLAEDDSEDLVPADVTIGYFDDSVFTFYYPDNLEALRRHGAELVPISSLSHSSLPDIDALYIGGGFPETHADRLVENRILMAAVKKAALAGLPIYAECGGLIYLCRNLTWNKNNYAMAGLFELDLEMHSKPVGHGYCELLVDTENPFYIPGTSLRGHEFHYSGPAGESAAPGSCMKVTTGVGLGDKRDGLVLKNTLACYSHIHAAGVGDWAAGMTAAARRYRRQRQGAATPDNNRRGFNSKLAVV